eukprot:CAMPEP_0175089054 /NCGR_PEP_ID=MMETSP0086_2-20121207/583_1 /TAXON_ID=136419 /ORGANISM="Unknown Unknown, Strain D1" /LENGTH=1255 /DNA_ID=CAMNT_0016361541 /DNA_START=227 /DNA_END=3994 /DNA_ORIENTATION=-
MSNHSASGSVSNSSGSSSASVKPEQIVNAYFGSVGSSQTSDSNNGKNDFVSIKNLAGSVKPGESVADTKKTQTESKVLQAIAVTKNAVKPQQQSNNESVSEDAKLFEQVEQNNVVLFGLANFQETEDAKPASTGYSNAAEANAAAAAAQAAVQKNTLSIIRGFENRQKQEAAVKVRVDAEESAKTEAEKEALTTALLEMPYSDFRLGFKSNVDAREMKQGGFADPEDFEDEFSKAERVFSSTDPAAEKLAATFDKFLNDSGLFTGNHIFADSPETSSLSKASKELLASVRNDFQDLISFLKKEADGGGQPFIEVSGGSGKAIIKWQTLFSSSDAQEDSAAAKAAAAKRQRMCHRAVQLVLLMRLKKFSARSVRVFDRRSTGTNYGVFRQDAKETQIIASHDLVLDAGEAVHVRTGPLQYNLTEALFEMKRDQQFLREDLVQFQSAMARQTDVLRDYVAMNKKLIQALAERVIPDPSGQALFFNEIQAQAQQDLAAAVEPSGSAIPQPPPTFDVDQTLVVNLRTSFLGVLGTNGYLPPDFPALDVSGAGTGTGAGGGDTDGEALEKLKPFVLRYVRQDVWDALVEKQNLNANLTLLAQRLGHEKSYLDEFFRLGDGDSDANVRLLNLLDSTNFSRPISDQDPVSVTTAGIASLLLSRALTTAETFRVCRFLRNQIGTRGSKVEVMEFFEVFKLLPPQPTLANVPSASRLLSWLKTVAQQVFLHPDQQRDNSDVANQADFVFANMGFGDLQAMQVTGNNGTQQLRIRVHVEQPPASSPNSIMRTDPKSKTGRLLGYSTVETMRFLGEIGGSLPSDPSGNLTFQLPKMDSLQGQRILFTQDGSGNFERQECYDLLLLSFDNENGSVRDDNLPLNSADGGMQDFLLNDGKENPDLSGILVNTDKGAGEQGGSFAFHQPFGDGKGTIAINMSRGGPLVTQEGVMLTIPGVCTTVHEFMHAIQGANGVFDKWKGNKIITEGLATMSELFCFAEVMLKMGGKDEVPIAETEAVSNVSLYNQGLGRGTWEDYRTHAVDNVFTTELADLDLSSNSIESKIGSAGQGYGHFMFWAVLASVLTQWKLNSPENIDYTLKTRELEWVLDLYRHCCKPDTDDNKFNFADYITDYMTTKNDGQAFLKMWTSYGPPTGSTNGPNQTNVKTGTTEADKQLRMKFVRHCVKCHFVSMVLMPENQTLASQHSVLRELFKVRSGTNGSVRSDVEKIVMDKYVLVDPSAGSVPVADSEKFVTEIVLSGPKKIYVST